MKHANLSIFIPHAGCPERCIFCDQQAISGETEQPTPKDVERLCEAELPWPIEPHDTEIAFFGGSFTAIDRAYMISLLDVAYRFVREGRARGVRISTRPDAIDQPVLEILKSYGVTAIELGAESMDDMVLFDNRRGHSRLDTIRAAGLIKKNGFSLGLQMMVGMYGEENAEKAAMKTAIDFIGIRPDSVRIYPTVVLRWTPLEHLFHIGAYKPLSLDEAADICGKLLLLFDKNGVKVIRTGLHSDMTVQESAVAGPYHPAFGEMARARAFRGLISDELEPCEKGGYTILVAKGQQSSAIGQKRSNIEYFKKIGYDIKLAESEALQGFDLMLEPCE